MKSKVNLSLMTLISIIICWLLPSSIWASVQVDGIYYELNTSAKTAAVASNPNKYTGNISIPASFVYDGTPYSVTSIGSTAFLDCREMTGISMPNSITTIAYSAFERCTGLTSLYIGKGVTSIDYEAFKNCINLTSLYLPASLKTIGNESFGGCTSLSMIVEERTTAPTIVSTTFNGVDKDVCTLYVPEGCKSAYSNAAYWKLFANIVDEPAIVATGYCGDNLTYTVYPDMTMVISGTGEMWNNYDSENPLCKEYSQSVQQVIIEEGVTSIAGSAFQGYSSLTSVDIPTSMKTIGGNAFTDCEALQRINISDLAEWCGIVFGDGGSADFFSGAFDHTPLYLNGEPIKDLFIPSDVTELSAYAFYHCESLASVFLPYSLRNIGTFAFYDCSNLNYLSIGQDLRYIGFNAFQNCSLLRIISNAEYPPVVELPALGIGNGCILYVLYGAKAAYEEAAEGNYHYWNQFDSIIEFDGPSEGIYYGLDPSDHTAKVITSSYYEHSEVTIPETFKCDGVAYTVTGIGYKAFEFFDNMKKIFLPSTITSVEDFAFSKCASLTDLSCYAEEPPIASASAFENLNVSEIVLHVPAGSKEAYRSAAGWKDFVNIVDESIVLETGSCGENTTYTIYSDGTMTISGTGAIDEFYPKTVSSNLIKELIIEEGVTYIEEDAFSGVRLFYGWSSIDEWQSLSSVHVPGSVTSIGQLVFLETPWYNSQPDGVVYAGKVVCGVKGIDGQDVILQEGTLGISASAFRGVHIASLYIPSSVVSIDPSLFSYEDFNVQSLSYDKIDFIVVDPENPYFDSRDNCNAIIETATNRLIVGSRNMQIPEGVTTLGTFSLSGQTSVTIPASVTRIEVFAFVDEYNYYMPGMLDGNVYWSNDSPIEVIEMKGSNPPEIKSQGYVYYDYGTGGPFSDHFSTFGGVHTETCVLRVPKGSKEAYQNAEGWKDFENIVEYDAEPDTDISAFDNAIYVEQVEGRIGGTMDIPIKLKNSYPVRGFQFTLELPEGTTINSWALSSGRLPSGATTSDKISTQSINGNKITVACSLNYGNATFTGNDGEIATVNVTFGDDMEVGSYPIYLTACDVTDANAVDEDLSDIKATLILEDYILGDANGDGKVRIGDATAILNYIVGRVSENFNEKAADANCDGKIRIGDATAVLNIIVAQ